MKQNDSMQSNKEHTKLEALIEDALDGRLDADALEKLHRSLEHYPELKGDWEKLSSWSPFQKVEQLEPERTFHDARFEQTLKRAWTRQTAGQNLYLFTYTYFKRYALAASLTILAALSLLNLQADTPGIPAIQGVSGNSGNPVNSDNSGTLGNSDISGSPGNPDISDIARGNSSEASTSESFLAEVQDYLYGLDENPSTTYYLTLFEAVPGQEEATNSDRPAENKPVNQTQP